MRYSSAISGWRSGGGASAAASLAFNSSRLAPFHDLVRPGVRWECSDRQRETAYLSTSMEVFDRPPPGTRRLGMGRSKFTIPALDRLQLASPLRVSDPDEKVFGIRTLQDAIRGLRQDPISEAAVKRQSEVGQ